MKKITLSLAALLLIGTYAANAQKRAASQAAITGTDNPATILPIKSESPAVTLPGKVIMPSKTQSQPYVENIEPKNFEEQRRLDAEREKRIALEQSKGVITVNFGIVKRNESIDVFCPFNIQTLEHQETNQTPTISLKNLERYSYWSNPSAVSKIEIGYGPLQTKRFGKSTGVTGDGFYITYAPTTQLGAVDETVTVFTKSGNLSYRIIGYVYAQDGETTVSK